MALVAGCLPGSGRVGWFRRERSGGISLPSGRLVSPGRYPLTQRLCPALPTGQDRRSRPNLPMGRDLLCVWGKCRASARAGADEDALAAVVLGVPVVHGYVGRGRRRVRGPPVFLELLAGRQT